MAISGSFFPQTVVQVIQRDAIKRLHIDSLLTEKEMLATVVPDVHLVVATLMSLGRAIPEKNKDMARQVVRKVVDDLLRKLSSPTQQAVTGALNRSARRRNPRYNEIDWKTTIIKNLKNYSAPVQDRHSGSQDRLRQKMQGSEGHHSLSRPERFDGNLCRIFRHLRFGTGLLPSVNTRMVVFDTSVVDLTDDLQDPVGPVVRCPARWRNRHIRALTYCQGCDHTAAGHCAGTGDRPL